MCRLLYVRSESPLPMPELLKSFAVMSRDSREYQGHGWGCAWLENDHWRMYHAIDPVWEDDLDSFGSSHVFMVHARSAFRDEGIAVENNMPFSDGESIFIFNGELNGVRIRESGRIGAEKIYNYIRRFDKGDKLTALRRGTDIIHKRTRYVRAMNIVLAAKDRAWFASSYSEDPDYFQLHRTQTESCRMVSSQPLPSETGWQRITNGSVEEI